MGKCCTCLTTCPTNCSVCPFCGGPVCGDCGVSTSKGPKGQKGKGVPKGGLPGQVLTKLTEESYETYWTYPIEGTTGPPGPPGPPGGGVANTEIFEINANGTLIFSLTFPPVAESEGVFLNGLKQRHDSYSLVGVLLTLDPDVQTITGDTLEVSYVY